MSEPSSFSGESSQSWMARSHDNSTQPTHGMLRAHLVLKPNERKDMKRITQSLLTLLSVFTAIAAQPAHAQQPQIPTLQVCNVPGIVVGQGTVNILSRGTFSFA